ncbi:hypothetical protein DFH11DRAFT_1729093 [Phellopilus nigrolimitatus]|nr:hypothetical protein DFH11DRAFT_1729093 [Phellopilus nigrolimitatus]
MLSSQESRFSAAVTAVNDAANEAMYRLFDVGPLDDLTDAEPNFPVGTLMFKDTLSRGKAAFRTLKKLRTVLNNLLDLSEETMDAIQPKLNSLVLQDGIDTLPDHVLAVIFECLCVDKDAGPKEPAILSHVSRRFRRIALTLSRIWTKIDFRSIQSHDQLDTWLSRSKGSKLDIMVSDDRDEYFPKIADVSVCSRVQTLSLNPIETLGYIGEEKMLAEDLYNHFDGLSFPALEHLGMAFSDYITESDENQALLCPTWDMPNLRSLMAYNIIPKQSSLSFLTHCELSFVSYKSDPIIGNPFQLLSFFRSTPKLRHLALRFESVSFPGMNAEEAKSVGVTALTNLESFSLKILHEVNAEEYRQLMNHTHFPALSRLTVAFYLAEEKSRDGWIEYVLFNVDDDRKGIKVRYPMLEDLTLLFRAMNGHRDPMNDNSPLACISNLAPALKHLTIDAPTIPSPLQSYSSYPNLRTLTLRRLFDLSDSYVTDLIGQKPSSGQDAFERLEIAGCPDLDLEALEKALPKTKICWRDRAPKYEGDYDPN